MMPNQKKNCREVCVQAQKLLEEKRRKEEKGRGDEAKGIKGDWGPRARCFLAFLVPSSSVRRRRRSMS